ncbi:MAG: hypothetical protein JWM88_2235 [Verrucomicrobia bacterium]|nr:hypothetical protein [Verrucomicrobiota bacterium]
MNRIALSIACVGLVALLGSNPAAAAEGKAADNHIYAQQLVTELMAGNSDLMGAGLHAIPPDGTEYQIVAQLRDIIGRKSSEDDLEIIKQDATRIYPDTLGGAPRMKALAPLRDRGGRIIGLAALSFRLGPGVTKLAVHARLDDILNQLASRIPDRAALFRPAP